jgi:hypothetical protein
MDPGKLLPRRAFDLDHASGNEDGNGKLTKVLAEEAAFPLMRWRVHGDVRGDDVHLWYSLRRRPPALAPQLHARWQADGRTGARLVGEFRQDRGMALTVFWAGVVFALLLLWLSLRGGLALHWTVIGMAFFVGYPWLAWFMHENHVEKIDTLVRRALGAEAERGKG